MTIIGIIPARFASTRFPGKPLVDIKGKTMIQRVYEQASKVLAHVCVATDDERIQKAVLEFGGEVVMTATQHESGTDRCAEALQLFETKNNIKADVLVNIQGDEPFIDPIQIQQLINLFEDAHTEIATLIKKVTEVNVLGNQNVVKVVRGIENEALYFSRNCIPFVRNAPAEKWLEVQDFYQHVGMYAYRRKVLFEICKLPKSTLEIAESLEQLRWLENGFKINTAITTLDSVGIDTPQDLEMLLRQIKD